MATLTATSKSDLLLKYAVAQPNDVIVLASVIDFGSDKFQMNRSGVMLTGGGLSFSPPAGTSSADFGNQNCFGIIVGGINGGGIIGSKLTSTVGLFWMNPTSNLTFTNNDISYAQGNVGIGYNALGFFCTSSATNMNLNNNWFHDSPNGNRNLEIWGFSGHYDGNIFENINDGGHLMNPGNFTFDGNWGQRLHRMALEVQQTSGTTTDRPICSATDNTFFDWLNPYYDSMGMSLPIQSGGFDITRNYLRHNAVNGQWGIADGGGTQRGSYGIEAPISGANIYDNDLGGERDVEAVSCPGVNTPVHDNRVYGGTYAWGLEVGEPGPIGSGNAVGTGNTLDPNLANMPAPKPRPNLTGVTTPTLPTTPTNPTPPMNTPQLTLTAIDDTSFMVSVANLPVNAFNLILHSISVGGGEAGPVGRIPVTSLPAKASGFKTSWVYNFTGQIVDKAGNTLAATNIVQFQVLAPAVIPPTQPTQPQGIKVLDHIVLFYKDGTSETKP